jgi:serine/threonine protein kinase, bacterial
MDNLLVNNRYRIIKTLGRGGFGETFLAVDTHMPSKRKCVLKRLKPLISERNSGSWVREKFQQEAAILETLGEENTQIPQLYAYFAEKGDFYLVQEWIEGATLAEKVFRDGNLPEQEVRAILLNLLPVLDYLHNRRIVHRDIKPDNIILRSSDNKPVLIDFGAVKEAVATVMQPQGHSTVSMAIGTPGYMASEQAAGRPLYSSDLYSLGLTAIFLLTGKHPQNLDCDSHTGEILWRRELPNLHSNLAMAIDRSIRFNPRDRFTSAREMQSFLRSTDSKSSKPTNLTAPPASVSSRRQTIAYKPNTLKSLDAKGTLRTQDNPQKRLGKFFLGFFLTLAIACGAFLIGFWVFFQQKQVQERDSNIFPAEDTSPVPFTPTITPSNEPTSQPTTIPRRTPTIRQTPTPTPEATVSPEVTPTTEPTITPTPEATPTAEPPTTPTPATTPTTEPPTTPTPTTNPEIKLTPRATPEANPVIKLTPRATPEATPTTNPTPETVPNDLETNPTPNSGTSDNP